MAHPEKYKNYFDAVGVFLTHCIDKRGPTPIVKVASVAKTRTVKLQKTSAIHGTFKRKIELKIMTQSQNHSDNSCMSSGTRWDS